MLITRLLFWQRHQGILVKLPWLVLQMSLKLKLLSFIQKMAFQKSKNCKWQLKQVLILMLLQLTVILMMPKQMWNVCLTMLICVRNCWLIICNSHQLTQWTLVVWYHKWFTMCMPMRSWWRQVISKMGIRLTSQYQQETLVTSWRLTMQVKLVFQLVK